MIKVLVNGYQGRMGQETVKAIHAAEDLVLVGQSGKADVLVERIRSSGAQVVVDFTEASAVYDNVCRMVNEGVHVVVGTSGLLAAQMTQLSERFKAQKTGCIVAPNCSLGAILMMKAAQEMARYFGYAEIIEMHHHQKQDAPSATAVKTAELVSKHLGSSVVVQEASPKATQETLKGARGAQHHNIPIHSVRLPGLMAQQTVVFGGHAECVSIRHDTLNRSSFMPGVLLACRKVLGVQGLVYGLEDWVT